ncbi:hypothetical protein O1157_20900 [Streptomyces albogriseolus]
MRILRRLLGDVRRCRGLLLGNDVRLGSRGLLLGNVRLGRGPLLGRRVRRGTCAAPGWSGRGVGSGYSGGVGGGCVMVLPSLEVRGGA